MVKKILIVADLHVGSSFAIWHPDAEISGGKWILNAAQRSLWRAWNSMINNLTQENFTAIVVNGDTIDGVQHRSLGIPCVTTNVNEQAESAVMILEPLRSLTQHMYIVRGTEYHDSISGTAINEIGRELNCEEFRQGQFSTSVLNLDVDGVILNFSHYISVMSGLYRATALDREGVWAALSGRSKTPDAKCVVRSHIHYFVHVEHSTRHIVVTPCWQVHTEYQIRKGYYRFYPEIGAVIIEINRQDDDPIRITKMLWQTPPERVYRV